MQGFLSLLMVVLFIGLIVGLVKPSLLKMKSRWRVTFVWLIASVVVSLGLPKPKHTAQDVVEEAKKQVIMGKTRSSNDSNQKSSALYDMFNKKEEKEVLSEVKKSEKEEWIEDYTDDFKVSFVKPFFMSYPSVEKFANRYGEEKIKPMIFNIVDCIDGAVKNKKYKDKSMEIIIDACMRMELLKNSK